MKGVLKRDLEYEYEGKFYRVKAGTEIDYRHTTVSQTYIARIYCQHLQDFREFLVNVHSVLNSEDSYVYRNEKYINVTNN